MIYLDHPDYVALDSIEEMQMIRQGLNAVDEQVEVVDEDGFEREPSIYATLNKRIEDAITDPETGLEKTERSKAHLIIDLTEREAAKVALEKVIEDTKILEFSTRRNARTLKHAIGSTAVAEQQAQDASDS